MFEEIPTDLSFEEFKQRYVISNGNKIYVAKIYGLLFKPKDGVDQWTNLMNVMSDFCHIADLCTAHEEKLKSNEDTCNVLRAKVSALQAKLSTIRDSMTTVNGLIGAIPPYYHSTTGINHVMTYKPTLAQVLRDTKDLS